MIDTDKPTFLSELTRLVEKLTNIGDNIGGKDSVEMKMSSKGERYYDIKQYRREGETLTEYLIRFDELDKAMRERSLRG